MPVQMIELEAVERMQVSDEALEAVVAEVRGGYTAPTHYCPGAWHQDLASSC